MNRRIFILLMLVCIGATILCAEGNLFAMGEKKEFVEPIEPVGNVDFVQFGDGMFRRHYVLGVEIQKLNEQLAQYFGVEYGVLINGIVKDSPADSVGLQAGDIIVKMDETPIESPGDIRQFMNELEEGATVRLTYIRKGTEHTVDIVPTEFPQIQIFSASDVNIEAFLEDLGELRSLQTVIDLQKDSLIVHFDSLRTHMPDIPHIYWSRIGKDGKISENIDELKEEIDELKKQLEALRRELEKMRKEDD